MKTLKKGGAWAWSIIKRMIRSIKRWWLLRHLRNNCWDHLVQQDIELIKNGVQVGVLRSAYLETLKTLPRNQKLDEEKLKKRVDVYNSLINSAINEGLIIAFKRGEDQKDCIKVSFLGDDYLSMYWHKATWNSPIGTGIIIAVMAGLLIWFAKAQLNSVIQPKTNPIYQIQIIPPASTGTIIY